VISGNRLTDSGAKANRSEVMRASTLAETIKKALDQKTPEAESLRVECEQLKARQSQNSK
jgi:hypothetical protein